jgi:hypothetical protein
VFRDRVKDSTTTTGTGTITVSGTAPTAYVAFGSAYPVGDRVPYAIVHTSLNEWETGLGTLVTATTISRDQVWASSNANALVNFSAGAKDVWANYGARDALSLSISTAFNAGYGVY